MAAAEWRGACREAGAGRASALLRGTPAACRALRRLAMATVRRRLVAARAVLRTGLRAGAARRGHFLEGRGRRGGTRRSGQQCRRRERGSEKRQAKQPGHFGEVLIRMAVDVR